MKWLKMGERGCLTLTLLLEQSITDNKSFFLLKNEEEIQQLAKSFIPQWETLVGNMSWSAVANTFCESIKIPQTNPVDTGRILNVQ